MNKQCKMCGGALEEDGVCENFQCPPAKHGGTRPGAGRKPRTIKRKSITVRLEPQDADRLRELCRSEEMSQANWIAKQIRNSDQ